MQSVAMVVLSGGQDSTTCLYWAKSNFDYVRAVTFDYGQKHRIEIDAAIKIAKMADVASHDVLNVAGLLRSSSPLLSDNPLEKYENADQMEKVIGERVELTFVPMRNTFFLTVAMNLALHYGIRNLVTGVCQEDNANYPDCTASFINALEFAFRESLAHDVNIITPLISKTKKETVRMALDYQGCWQALSYSHTSYDGKYPPTDMNHANVLRAKGFQDAGLPDPLVVRAFSEGLMELPITDNYLLMRTTK